MDLKLAKMKSAASAAVTSHLCHPNFNTALFSVRYATFALIFMGKSLKLSIDYQYNELTYNIIHA